MTFSNFVALVPGVPIRLHFTDYYRVEREVLEKESGKTKRIWTNVFYTNEVDGEPSSRTFSVMSQKLWAHLEPYVPDNEYRGYDFIITEMGSGFFKDWNVQVIRRPE